MCCILSKSKRGNSGDEPFPAGARAKPQLRHPSGLCILVMFYYFFFKTNPRNTKGVGSSPAFPVNPIRFQAIHPTSMCGMLGTPQSRSGAGAQMGFVWNNSAPGGWSSLLYMLIE